MYIYREQLTLEICPTILDICVFCTLVHIIVIVCGKSLYVCNQSHPTYIVDTISILNTILPICATQ
jgi:hypothetical protein